MGDETIGTGGLVPRRLDDLLAAGIQKMQVDGRKATLVGSVQALANNPDQFRTLVENPDQFNQLLSDNGLALTPEGQQELQTYRDFIDAGNIAEFQNRIANFDQFLAVASDSASTTASATSSLTASGI